MTEDTNLTDADAAKVAELVDEFEARDAQLRGLLNKVLDMMDASEGPYESFAVAAVTLDCVFHHLIEQGMPKHGIASLLRKVAREL